jgi:hypothetical protein
MSNNSSRKNVPLAFVLGLLLPGLGLAYAAPWLVAGLGTVVAIVVYKLLGWIPIIGSVAMGLAALLTGGLNVLYARAYNNGGARVGVS